jgi:hypothetical protein
VTPARNSRTPVDHSLAHLVVVVACQCGDTFGVLAEPSIEQATVSALRDWKAHSEAANE